jgi:selenocysteine lyase/cysteine desulfurase
MPEWWQELRSELPICQKTAYFFAGLQGPLATEVRTAMNDVIARWDETGWRITRTMWDVLAQSQAAIANIADCSPTRVVTCEGTSSSLNIASLMILQQWRASGARKANVVLHSEVHAAGSYPWHNAARLGEQIELRWPEARPGESDIEAVASAVDDNTIAVTISHVSHRTGARFDVTKFADRFPDRRFALVIDSAQSAGAVALEAEVEAADFVGFPAYKWLLGPPGVGFLVISEKWLVEPGPPLVGWASTPDAPGDARTFELSPAANGFRLGIPNQIGLAGAVAALELWSRFGTERIAGRIERLTQRFLAGVDDLRLPSPTPRTWPDRAGVVSLRVKEPEALRSELSRRRLDTGVSAGVLRVDIHAYNDESEVDRLLEALRAIRPA